ncbi:outer membrane protein [Alteraurantiacibacter palmitatis]|uniref:Outer membrane protein n=1 Tax=Alteraurantiacibacter palmitatis TaxID=2054628 RepID=A0ABV7E8R4_9SPHN
MTAKYLLIAGAALAGTATASPAAAQDAFQGPYVSVFGGLNAVRDRAADSLVFDTDRDGAFDDTVRTATDENAFGPGFCNSGVDGATRPCLREGRGAEYGARLGYDMRLGGGPFLVGGIAEISRSEVTDSTTGFSTTPASYTVSREMDYALSARARAGLVLEESVLVYGTGGVSWARIDHSFATTNTANSFTEVNDDKLRRGWQYGGGVEFALSPGFTLGAEYLRSSYRDRNYLVEVGPGTAGPTNPFLLDNPEGTDLRPSSTNLRTQGFRVTGSLRF